MLECEILGNPAPRITWFKSDNRLIDHSAAYIYLHEASSLYKLVIRVRFLPTFFCS